jgi:hypothetical protein
MWWSGAEISANREVSTMKILALLSVVMLSACAVAAIKDTSASSATDSSASAKKDSSTKPSALENITTSFANVVTSSANILQTEISSKPAVRRAEAMELFLANPNDENNFTFGGDQRAFAQYACAGSGALHREKNFLDFAKAYATAAQGITKPGGDSFAEQWKKFQELRHKEMPEAPKDKNEDETGEKIGQQKLFEQCTIDVLKLIDFKGVPARDTTDEIAFAAIPAAIAAFQKLFSALEQIATDGLKSINTIEARKNLASYVQKMHSSFQSALSNELPPEKLDDAWQRREAQSLWAPYITFSQILTLKKKNASIYEIKELVVKLDSEMVAYDSIKSSRPPSDIVKALSTADDALFKAATDDKSSLAAISTLLGAIASDISRR